MSEKIDLAAYDVDGLICLYLPREQMDKWVRAVRAAMKFSNSGHVEHRMALEAALAPFTDSSDSAEVS